MWKTRLRLLKCVNLIAVKCSVTQKEWTHYVLLLDFIQMSACYVIRRTRNPNPIWAVTSYLFVCADAEERCLITAHKYEATWEINVQFTARFADIVLTPYCRHCAGTVLQTLCWHRTLQLFFRTSLLTMAVWNVFVNIISTANLYCENVSCRFRRYGF